MQKALYCKTIAVSLLGLPFFLSACSDHGPEKEDIARIEADILNIFVQPSSPNYVNAKAIKIVRLECNVVKGFDRAFDCFVSFTANDEPHRNSMRLIHHENGKWDVAETQPPNLQPMENN